MSASIFFYLGAFFTFAWGIAHLFPTRGVVAGFGEISEDNKHIITMEWINEGLTLMFIGALVATVTALDTTGSVSLAIYWLAIVMLVVLSIVSLFTGFKVNFIPFKLCPPIFTLSAILILIGILLR